MKRGVLYARVSTDAQQKEGTIESQVLELKRQIAAAGDVLIKEFIDDGYSGTLVCRRPRVANGLRRNRRGRAFGLSAGTGETCSLSMFSDPE
jgi:site-specific DNA recombinase